MAEITTEEIRDFLSQRQGENTSLDEIRKEFQVTSGTKSFDAVRNIMFQLIASKIVRPLGRGVYKIITQVEPIKVFTNGRERRPPFNLFFPKDSDRGMPMDFAEHIVIREGDLITIGGVKSKGKTTLCLGFTAENIDNGPVLMGNEYSVLVENRFDPAPRFLNRLDAMSGWVVWTNEDGNDKFKLLPVRDDYAEHIIKDKINIIDWINLDADKSYDIGKVLENIKKNLGKGVAIISLQKGEGNINPRGGQFVRDFSDLEILLDGFGDSEDDILLTIKGAKEKTAPVVGKTYAYTIWQGVKIFNFREVKRCSDCRGQGYGKGGKCETCDGRKYIDV